MVHVSVCNSFLQGIIQTISVFFLYASYSWHFCTWGIKLWYLSSHWVGSKVCYQCWHTLRDSTYAQMTHTERYCIAQIKKMTPSSSVYLWHAGETNYSHPGNGPKQHFILFPQGVDFGFVLLIFKVFYILHFDILLCLTPDGGLRKIMVSCTCMCSLLFCCVHSVHHTSSQVIPSFIIISCTSS